MNVKQILGKVGEDLALEYLQEHGYELIDRNWRCARGEIDLIVSQAASPVFVEVKTRRNFGFGDPLEAIDTRKARRLHVLALAWLAEHDRISDSYRVDALGITFGVSTSPMVEHVIGVLP